jgi:hypothetical protein
MTSTNEHTEVTGEVEAQIRAIRKTIGEQWSEILSATLLAVVAIGTAWSGYQSAQWGGASSRYSLAGLPPCGSNRRAPPR